MKAGSFFSKIKKLSAFPKNKKGRDRSMNDIIFESERLYFRFPRKEDAQEITLAMNEFWDALQQWMSWAHDGLNTLESTQYYIETICAQEREKGGLPLAGFDKKTNKFVILTGFNVTEETASHEFLTGYWIAKSFLKQGYATESTKAVLKHAFNQHQATRIITSYYEHNLASKRVMEKCGFVFTHTKPKAHARCSDGTLLDEHCYAITKKQWKEFQP